MKSNLSSYGLNRPIAHLIRGFQKEPIKERITIRLSPEVVKQFRNTGDGWQTRVDAALKDWLKANAPARP